MLNFFEDSSDGFSILVELVEAIGVLAAFARGVGSMVVSDGQVFVTKEVLPLSLASIMMFARGS